ncbi:MAG: cytochrome c [Cyanobacteria bacterium]|nr:cytochrome c [Cyanobacteriota bacterium]
MNMTSKMTSQLADSTLLLAALLIPIFSGCSQTNTPSEDILQPASGGKGVFQQNCIGCHALNGAMNPMSMSTLFPKSSHSKDLQSFKAYLRNPVNNQMPAFDADILPDEDVKLLYEFLKNPR